MAVYGLNGNGPFIRFSNLLRDSVVNYGNSRQQESIKSYIYSIDHKLNIVRYNAGLIQELRAEDFKKHRDGDFNSADLPTVAGYQRGRFEVHDFDDYLLFLAFFLEAMTATAFSLLDVIGHLLKEMYDLNLPRTVPTRGGRTRRLGISFVNSANDMQGRDVVLYAILEKYLVGQSNSVPWISPLKNIRNATTHERITHICKFVEKIETEPWLSTVTDSAFEWQIRNSYLNSANPVTVQRFLEDAYNGLEEFVFELFTFLHTKLENDQQIPLY